MRLNAIIVEDEKNARELLEHYADKYCNLNISGYAETVDDAEKLILLLAPDIVFLDISLPIHNGFELLKRFAVIGFEIIFITAFDQFAIQAIKVSAVDYLLKPIDIKELKFAVEKARLNIEKKNQNQNLRILQENIGNTILDQKLSIANGSNYDFVYFKEILFFKGAGRYTEIFLKNNTRYLVSKNLGEYEDILDSYLFIRVHNSFIVNLNEIDKFVKKDNAYIVLKNGEIIEVSKRRKDFVFEILNNRS